MKKEIKLLLILGSFSLCCFAQTDREFWFAAPAVDGNNAHYNLPIVVRLTSFTSPATVTLSIPANPSFTPIEVSLPANATQTIDLSQWVDWVQSVPPDIVQDKGLLIQSTADITAYYEVVSSYCNCNPEIFSLKGRNALGSEFYISSQYTYSIDTIRQPAATTSFDIVATQDNTTVAITPSQPIVGHATTNTFFVVLNKGQTYSATGIYRDLNHHLQGSLIQCDKPIAVTLKDDLVWGDGTCADLIGDQTVPVEVTGNEYIVSKGYLSPRDRVFILAINDNTSIFLDGNTTASVNLNRGQSWTFNLSNSSTYIRGDKNFYVYHVTGNGCELGSAIIPKLNCTGSSSVSIVRSSNDKFGVMLITKNGSQGSFTVNGAAGVVTPGSFTPVPGTNGVYVSATIDLSSYLPAGSVLNVGNPAAKFSMGFLNGGVQSGCRYAFFSEYKASNVSNTRTEICLHDSAQLNAFGGVSYEWSPSTGLNDPHIANPRASPAASTTYKVIITGADGCADSASITVGIRPVPVFQAPLDETVCEGLGVPLSSANGKNYVYRWSPATGLDNASAPYPVARPPANTRYTLRISDSVCTAYDSTFTVQVTVRPVPVITAEKENDIDCAVHMAQLKASGGVSYSWSPAAGLNDPSLPDPIASIDSTTTFVVKGTGRNSCYAFDTLTVNVTATGHNLFVVPNAFTPNGDGHNDCFGITRWGDVQIEELSVFNRWGLRVFTTRNPSECWDGSYKGRPQPSGAYVYAIRAHTFCGAVTRRGVVMLIR
jgi:gliding motility-associated-like protein